MDIELLYKKWEGNLTQEEEIEFNQWWEASPAHQAYFEAFAKKQCNKLPYSLPDETFGFYREEYRRKLRKKRIRRMTIRWGVSLSGIAAALLVGWFFYPTTPPTSTPVEGLAVTAKVDSLPAIMEQEKVSNKKVRLVTATGQTLTLQQLATLNQSVPYTVDSSFTSLAYAKTAPVPSGKEQLNEVIIDRGADLSVVLSDGTHVWLNSDSKLKYPETFRGNERKVYLEGEAYFEVTKDSRHAFVVHAGGTETRVYGTEFNINARDEKCIRTTLVRGSVSVRIDGSDKETMLTPGHSAEMNKEKQTVEVTDKDILLYTGWKSGQYYFENTSLEQLFEEIARWHDVKITFADEELKNEHFTGCIPRTASLRKILNMMLKTSYITFEKNGSEVILKNASAN